MLGAIARKIFGSANDRRLKTYAPKVKAINALEQQVAALSDEALRARTQEFRDQLAAGRTLDDLLVPAFATVREAAKRTLGQRHFDVQLIGGMVLHEGGISEMRTGEGKTLVATLASYLNALAGKGVHVVTVNDYLAKRDSEWMGRVHRFLGMSVGVIVHDLSDAERAAAYACDITYGTNNEFGFDYLRDNMKYELSQMVQRGHAYAIVDEVDSILIDEARTPLIISGAVDDKSDLYNTIDKLIPKLAKEDYDLDEKQRSISLTEAGNEHMEQLLIDAGALTDGALYEAINVTLVHHINQALRAHKLFQKDKDYIVRNGEVVIIDEFTGRMMPGRRYSEGLHQALEAKERVQVQPENVTLASITFQNYFRLYEKLAGMTGTASTEAAEFAEIYNLDVVEIPTNRPVQRLDEDDEIYRTAKEKLDAIALEIAAASEKMQPMLVGTTSIEKSEQLAEFLKAKGYKQIDFANPQAALAKLYAAARSGTPSKLFAVLNARFHEQEATIVAEAGVPAPSPSPPIWPAAAPTFSSAATPTCASKPNAPGSRAPRARRRKRKSAPKSPPSRRRPSPPAALYRRHRAPREPPHRQSAARSRRPSGGSRPLQVLPVAAGRSHAHLRIRAHGFDAGEARPAGGRGHRPQLDQQGDREGAAQGRGAQFRHPQEHSEIRQRHERPAQGDLRAPARNHGGRERRRPGRRHARRGDRRLVSGHIPPNAYAEAWDSEGLEEAVRQRLNLDLPVVDWAKEEGIADEEIKERLLAAAEESYAERVERNGEPLMRMIEKQVVLQALDTLWREHLVNLDHLRQVIGWRGLAQRDPLNEYKSEALELFRSLMTHWDEAVISQLMRVEVTYEAPPQELPAMQMEHPAPDGLGGGAGEAGAPGALDELNRRLAATDFSAAALGAASAGATPQRDPGNPASWGKVGRNEPCPCGSGKKFKHCHGALV